MKDKNNDIILISAFSFLLISIIVISLVGLSSLKKINILFDKAYNQPFVELVETERMNVDLIAVHRAMKDVALSKTDSQLTAALDDVNYYDTEINKHFITLYNLDSTNILLDEVVKEYRNWEPIRAKTIELARNGQYEVAAENTRTVGALQVDLIYSKMQALIVNAETEANIAYQTSNDISQNAILQLLWLAFFVVLLSLGISLVVRRRLRNYEDKIFEQKNQLQITFDSIGDGVITIDTNRNVLRLNKVAEKHTGWQTEDALGKPFTKVFEITNEFTGEKAKDPVEKVFLEDKICELENHTILTSKDGSFRYIADSAAPIKGHNGVTTGVVMIFRDVTEQKQLQQELSDSEEHYRMLFNSMLNGYALHEIIFDENGIPCDYRFVDINPAFEEMTGLKKSEVIGRSIKELIPETESYWLETYGKVVLTGEPKKYENYSEAFKKYFDVYAFSPIKNHFAVLVADITERKNREKEILYLNYHDVLTGLHNRAFFEKEKERLDIDSNLPISLIWGDINGLKLINDGFGHDAGDKLLVEISNILSSCCRKQDVLARIGGDEFSILLPKTSNDEAQEICRSIYIACEEYEGKAERRIFKTSISLGYATKTEPSESIEGISNHAEEAMYRRKLLDGKSMHSALMNSIKSTMNEKSHETEEHAERLINLSRPIGKALGLAEEQLNELELLATLHDIGKMSISDSILNKPGKPTDAEWFQMKKHPEVGYRIAKATTELAPIAEYILCHHERWDGKGYPQGLIGEKIPLLSRILSVVDSYDAMTNDRPYRKAISRADAITEIKNSAGVQFDPDIVRIFIDEMTNDK